MIGSHTGVSYPSRTLTTTCDIVDHVSSYACDLTLWWFEFALASILVESVRWLAAVSPDWRTHTAAGRVVRHLHPLANDVAHWLFFALASALVKHIRAAASIPNYLRADTPTGDRVDHLGCDTESIIAVPRGLDTFASDWIDYPSS